MKVNALLEKLKQKKLERAAEAEASVPFDGNGLAPVGGSPIPPQGVPGVVAGPPRETYVLMKQPGEKLGMGISTTCDVESVLPMTPAGVACLQNGVKIIEVNGIPISTKEDIKTHFIAASGSTTMRLTVTIGTSGTVPEPQNIRTANAAQSSGTPPLSSLPPPAAVTPPPPMHSHHHHHHHQHQHHHHHHHQSHLPQYQHPHAPPTSGPPGGFGSGAAGMAGPTGYGTPLPPPPGVPRPVEMPPHAGHELPQGIHVSQDLAIIDSVIADIANARNPTTLEESLRASGAYEFLNPGHENYDHYLQRRKAFYEGHMAITSAFKEAVPELPTSTLPTIDWKAREQMEQQAAQGFAPGPVSENVPPEEQDQGPIDPEEIRAAAEVGPMKTPSVLAAMGGGTPPPGRMYHKQGGLVGGINAPLTPLQIKSMQRNVPRTSMLNSFYSSGTIESNEAAANRFASMSNKTDVGGYIDDSDASTASTPRKKKSNRNDNEAAENLKRRKSESASPSQSQMPSLPPEDYTCTVCMKRGHWGNDCPLSKIAVASAPPASYKCRICDQKGHWAKDCTKKAGDTEEKAGPPKAFKCKLCGQGGHWTAECTNKGRERTDTDIKPKSPDKKDKKSKKEKKEKKDKKDKKLKKEKKGKKEKKEKRSKAKPDAATEGKAQEPTKKE